MYLSCFPLSLSKLQGGCHSGDIVWAAGERCEHSSRWLPWLQRPTHPTRHSHSVRTPPLSQHEAIHTTHTQIHTPGVQGNYWQGEVFFYISRKYRDFLSCIHNKQSVFIPVLVIPLHWLTTIQHPPSSHRQSGELQF